MNGSRKTIKGALSFVLMSAFVLTLSVGAFSRVNAEAIATTPYVSTGADVQMGPGPVVLCSTLSGTLRIGDRDGIMPKRVTILQNFLNKKGYLSVSATGYFGSLTRKAVIAFQSQNGLKADGIVGVQTEAHISAVDCPANGVPSVTAPTISSITPSTGSVSTVVTITGTGFASDSILHFGSGVIKDPVVGNNGTTITFTVPSYVGPYCKVGMMCPQYVVMVSNGYYPVYVENANGEASNTVQLAVVSSQIPSL